MCRKDIVRGQIGCWGLTDCRHIKTSYDILGQNQLRSVNLKLSFLSCKEYTKHRIFFLLSGKVGIKKKNVLFVWVDVAADGGRVERRVGDLEDDPPSRVDGGPRGHAT